ncbi:DUF3120 domain-containing protein [Synechococcus sp. CC9311]|uniref:DUF3120 domain-containing protein n=1 Tax=Synechococcus sp. (strain CC9311) TaxID=64471 RepID=UPI001ED96D35|nr:DUF3120 domain-containing protein [Synechococcus sp. CC9311]
MTSQVPTFSFSRSLCIWASALVVLPVFLQAPWVRFHPFSSCLFTAVLLTTGILAAQVGNTSWKEFGTLLVGFSGSWLAGTLFWGWLRMHPVLHIPVEAIALPLAVGGLNSRWKLSCSFYLASLLGTAITDITMALTRVMSFWPEVVKASSREAPQLLNEAATLVLQPVSLLILLSSAGLIVWLAKQFWTQSARPSEHQKAWSVAAAVLSTTLLIDALFLVLSLSVPSLSGLI